MAEVGTRFAHFNQKKYIASSSYVFALRLSGEGKRVVLNVESMNMRGR